MTRVPTVGWRKAIGDLPLPLEYGVPVFRSFHKGVVTYLDSGAWRVVGAAGRPDFDEPERGSPAVSEGSDTPQDAGWRIDLEEPGGFAYAMRFWVQAVDDRRRASVIRGLFQAHLDGTTSEAQRDELANWLLNLQKERR